MRDGCVSFQSSLVAAFRNICGLRAVCRYSVLCGAGAVLRLQGRAVKELTVPCHRAAVCVC